MSMFSRVVSHIPRSSLAVVKYINSPVMSTIVAKVGLATTAGSHFILAVPNGKSAPINVEVTTCNISAREMAKPIRANE